MYFFGEDAASNEYKKIQVYAEAGGQWKKVSPMSEVIELNEWHYITWTYSSASGGKLYINGVDQGTGVGSGPLSVNEAALKIGDKFAGKLDEVKIYSSALNKQEILDEYASVLKFRFDEHQGNIIVDDTIYKNNGSSTNLTWTNGKHGSALSFEGSNSIIVPDSNSLDLSDEITVSFWMNPTTYRSDYASHLLRKRFSAAGANFDMYFFGEEAASNQYKKIQVYAEAGGQWKKVSPMSEVIELNEWHHITWTYSSANGGKLYIDGVDQDQGAGVGSGSLSVNEEALKIGDKFAGKIDEVRIYSKVLDENEILYPVQ